MLCPCGTGKLYSACCGPLHTGKLPENALQLMRSRYTAYALCKPDYIIHTTHPKNPHFRRDTTQWAQQISEFCSHTEFQQLDILDFQEKNDQNATVTFVAHLAQDKKDVSFTEKSTFEKVQGKWLYLSGEIH